MQLDHITLKNFRQFREATIQFAQDADENITVVHGSNGSGKTTLLNAFTWVFYDEVDFDTRPNRLANEGAMAAASQGDRIEVSVELGFAHEDRTYLATREIVYEKRREMDLDGEIIDGGLTLKYKEDGRWRTRENAKNTIDKIIPERLSGLFFFDGEDIDDLAGIDNQERIQEAIQNIMGLTILERATRHLGDVAKRFENEVDEFASDELSTLIDQKRELENDIDELSREYDDTKRAKGRVEQEINDIEQTLERLDESAALQERRNEYEKEKEQLEAQVADIEKQLKSTISELGFVPLAMPLLEETAQDLDKLREQGKIPSELSNSFIDSLLEAQRCICGRELKPDSEEYQNVAAMKGDALSDGVEQSAIRIVGHLNQLAENEAEYFERVDELIARRKDTIEDITKQEELIDKVSAELQDIDQTTDEGESVSDLETKREKKESEQEELINELGRIEEKIHRKEETIKELVQEIEDKEDEKEEALVAKRRQKTAMMTREELQNSFDELKNKVRRWSNERIRDTFEQIATKDMRAEITEDFQLKIRQDVGDKEIEVDKSTGERQIASLAFIGSLVSIARRRYESDSESEYFTGGIYPLVMDSPFGALDKKHRRKVSEVIPSLANQVVVFATDSQWEGPVEDEMSDSIGEQYWLNFSSGDGQGEYPLTLVEEEQAAARGD